MKKFWKDGYWFGWSRREERDSRLGKSDSIRF